LHEKKRYAPFSAPDLQDFYADWTLILGENNQWKSTKAVDFLICTSL
jgi:hypothetical protein